MVQKFEKMEKKYFKSSKEINFLIKVMCGGGAERVVTLLANAMVQRAYKVNLILTHQKKKEADLKDVDSKIKVLSLEDEIVNYPEKKVSANLQMLYARLFGKLGKAEVSSIQKYYARNYRKVCWLKEYFKQHRTSTVVAFLYDSIFLIGYPKKPQGTQVSVISFSITSTVTSNDTVFSPNSQPISCTSSDVSMSSSDLS